MIKISDGEWKAWNTVDGVIYIFAGDKTIGELYQDDTSEEAFANAKLISVAPEMYRYMLLLADDGDQSAIEILQSMEKKMEHEL
jgi:hypothetical protein